MTTCMDHRTIVAGAAIAWAALFLASAGADDSAPDNIARIRAGDRLFLQVNTTLPGNPINGVYRVEPSGKVPLGPGYGRVQVSGLTPEQAEVKVREHLATIIKDPQVSLTWYDPVAHGSRRQGQAPADRQPAGAEAHRPQAGDGHVRDLLDRVSKLEREMEKLGEVLRAELTKRGSPPGPR